MKRADPDIRVAHDSSVAGEACEKGALVRTACGEAWRCAAVNDANDERRIRDCVGVEGEAQVVFFVSHETASITL